MKNSHFGLGACLLALPTAAPALAAPTPQATFTPLIRTGSQLANGDTVEGIYSTLPNRFAAGYAAAIQVSPGNRQLIVADTVDVPGSAPSIRFESSPNPIALGLVLLDMANGRVAWNRWNSGVPDAGGYIDGVHVTGFAVPSPVPGATWFDGQSLRFKSNGDVIAVGTIRTGPGLHEDLIFNLTTSQMILRTGDLIPGTTRTFQYGFSSTNSAAEWAKFSPSGEHHVVVGTDSSTRSCMLVDGQQAHLLDTPMRNLEPLGPSVLVLIQRPVGTLELGLPAIVNDDGEWMAPVRLKGYVPGQIGTTFVNYYESAMPRGLVADLDGPLEQPVGFSPLGAPLLKERLPLQSIGRVVTPAGIVIPDITPVDIDDDGVLDPDWQAEFADQQLDFDGRGKAYAMALLRNTVTGETNLAVGRFEVPLPGSRSCPGMLNSTGHPANLLSLGQDQATASDLTLVGQGLPGGTFGLPLTSQTPDSIPNLAGGAGTLCLGGAIGRLNGSIFNAPANGSVEVPLDLTALPQGGGTVPVLPGSTWFFQLWYRDVQGGVATSNLSSALAVSFD